MKVFFGPTLYRWVESTFMQSVLRLLDHAARAGVSVTFAPQTGDALVERARSIVATRFLLDTDADVLLTVDGDIEFMPEDALGVCRQAMTYDLVGGVYVTRSRERCSPTSHFLPNAPIEFAADPTPREVMWAATGFLAVHRRVFERLAQDLPLCHPDKAWRFHPFYDCFTVDDEDGHPIYLSEDYALSERARRAGFSVYVNPKVRLGHTGGETFYLEHLVEPRELPVKAMQIERVTAGGYRVEALELVTA